MYGSAPVIAPVISLSQILNCRSAGCRIWPAMSSNFCMTGRLPVAFFILGSGDYVLYLHFKFFSTSCTFFAVTAKLVVSIYSFSIAAFRYSSFSFYSISSAVVSGAAALLRGYVGRQLQNSHVAKLSTLEACEYSQYLAPILLNSGVSTILFDLLQSRNCWKLWIGRI
jgi:hypothetical protein